jgi:hypothetical protein
MLPYKTQRLQDYPDVSDIHYEARNSSAGGKDYLRNKRLKSQTRRYLKRADKQKILQEIKETCCPY